VYTDSWTDKDGCEDRLQGDLISLLTKIKGDKQMQTDTQRDRQQCVLISLLLFFKIRVLGRKVQKSGRCFGES
jgi:hypothetical protein